jgi:hypothetical protein
MGGLLSGVEWDDSRKIVYDSIVELGTTLSVVTQGAGAVIDPEFGNVVTRDEEVIALLPYTERLAGAVSDRLMMRFKLLGKEGANFTAWSTLTAYVPTLAVERLIPGGELLREKHLFVIGGIYYQLDSIIPVCMRNLTGGSVLLQIFCSAASPAEQAGGKYAV